MSESTAIGSLLLCAEIHVKVLEVKPVSRTSETRAALIRTMAEVIRRQRSAIDDALKWGRDPYKAPELRPELMMEELEAGSQDCDALARGRRP